AFPQGSETILVVDDEDSVRELIREILETCGYQVMEAKNGHEAMEVYEREVEKIDLVITDLLMPMMSGQSLVDLLSFSHLQKRILYISGYLDDHLTNQDENKTKQNFIEKPFKAENLAQKVREILDSP
ncbi:MAG: response regulator, partial [Pyrinomonadaceae bacterium]